MVELNMMEEKFHARTMAEHKRTTYFAMKHEIVWSTKRSERRRGHESMRKHNV
jgi:hypothetical protein